jgi:predicted nuclease of predicted toxin-antitoxin system
VKLLFDQNLSHKLVSLLADVYVEGTHTRFLGLDRAADPEVWFHARTHGLLLVTKDSDLGELAVLRGAPPKVRWLRIGNCSTEAVEKLLRQNAPAIAAFAADPERVVYELFD